MRTVGPTFPTSPKEGDIHQLTEGDAVFHSFSMDLNTPQIPEIIISASK